jgi:hypothetical protein
MPDDPRRLQKNGDGTEVHYWYRTIILASIATVAFYVTTMLANFSPPAGESLTSLLFIFDGDTTESTVSTLVETNYAEVLHGAK